VSIDIRAAPRTVSASRGHDAERWLRLAEKNGRTVQQEIREALRDHVERQKD
jgi:hypothetical protein